MGVLLIVKKGLKFALKKDKVPYKYVLFFSKLKTWRNIIENVDIFYLWRRLKQ